MKVFVFRIAKGNPGGVVRASCPIEFGEKRKEIFDSVANTRQGLIPYETNGYKEYLKSELWDNYKLRQGWGFKGLDLRQKPIDWINNYLEGMRKYWNFTHEEMKEIDACETAAGRFDMLESALLSAKKGDVIIIPSHSNTSSNSNPLHNSKSFTVLTVNGDYEFDVDENYKDFGHIIPVTNLKVFSYGDDFVGKDFTGYYQRAVIEIKKNYKLHNKVMKFLKEKYL
ncbi:hypothetical protein [Arcobacter sp.]|uniref:hypothetical protein n=1 Tax=Arcobacter sp. TaxID=1872629 RepID=UPI003D0EAA62